MVGPPLWKIWKSIGMIRNPIYGKISQMATKPPTRFWFSSQRKTIWRNVHKTMSNTIPPSHDFSCHCQSWVGFMTLFCPQLSGIVIWVILTEHVIIHCFFPITYGLLTLIFWNLTFWTSAKFFFCQSKITIKNQPWLTIITIINHD